jgi:hypothetical protein
LQGDGCGGRGERSCPAGSSRTLAYGLLGPDAVSLIYRGAGGRLYTEPTDGPLGAYLIVGARPSGTPNGQTSNSTLQTGPIVSVTYRGGHACRTSTAPSGDVTARQEIRFARTGCKPVGYAAPQVRRASAAEVAAPIHVQKLPAIRYCSSGPESIALCRTGQSPLAGASNYLLVDVSFIAHIATPTTNTYYRESETNSSDNGCVGGDAQTIDRVVAGQRVVFQDQVSRRCHGTISGTVSYVAASGAGGSQSGPTGPPGSVPRGAVVVGHYTINLR